MARVSAVYRPAPASLPSYGTPDEGMPRPHALYAAPSLRMHRIEAMLSQESLAARVGVARSAITNSEAGGVASAATIQRLASSPSNWCVSRPRNLDATLDERRTMPPAIATSWTVVMQALETGQIDIFRAMQLAPIKDPEQQEKLVAQAARLSKQDFSALAHELTSRSAVLLRGRWPARRRGQEARACAARDASREEPLTADRNDGVEVAGHSRRTRAARLPACSHLW